MCFETFGTRKKVSYAAKELGDDLNILRRATRWARASYKRSYGAPVNGLINEVFGVKTPMSVVLVLILLWNSR